MCHIDISMCLSDEYALNSEMGYIVRWCSTVFCTHVLSTGSPNFAITAVVIGRCIHGFVYFLFCFIQERDDDL